jgi:hypothetical protein
MIIGEPISTVGMVPRQMNELSDHVRHAMSDIYYSRSTSFGRHPERRHAERSASESKDPLDRNDSFVS